MKRSIVLLPIYATLSIFLSCSNNAQPSANLLNALSTDSVTVMFDSSNKMNFSALPLYDQSVFDTVAIRKFFELADKTGGDLKILINNKLLLTVIKDIIKNHVEENTDVLFLIDKTGSMVDDIDIIKSGMIPLMKQMNKFENVHLAIGLYGDKNTDGADWFTLKNFGSDFDLAVEFMESIYPSDGGDWPESVYDAVFKVDEYKFWRTSAKKIAILIGDACPLEKPLSTYTIDDVILRSKVDEVAMNFYPIVVTPFTEGDPELSAAHAYTEKKILKNFNVGESSISFSFHTEDEYKIFIYNISGTELLHKKVKGIDFSENTATLQPGTYIFRALRSDNVYETKKFRIPPASSKS